MKIKELRMMSEKELDEKFVELKKELIKINAQIATGTNPKSPGQVKTIKKTLAKIKTIKQQKNTEKSKQ
ncbi:50S ribosomal protein L29 [Candidatus Woesearchaeota archaeon]|nr:MAG: 50S ribosomal protein L29 [Candidatus Woesearchaeota archaeon]